MVRGKTIEIYLPEGNPRGIKEFSINISIIRGFLIPRNLLKDLTKYEQLSKQGIYFLMSEKDSESLLKVYIGEAEDLIVRIKQHDAGEKDYWNYAICFTSTKDNLNKAHYKYLENYCYKTAKEANRCEIKNSVNPTLSKISKQDQDMVLSFFDDLNLILSTLGYSMFDKLKEVYRNEKLLYCKTSKGIEAIGSLTEEGLVVFAGSKSVLTEVPSAIQHIKSHRERLKEEGIISEENGFLVFKKDHVFGSPSTAASMVLGRSANGWIEWKDDNGKTLDEIKRSTLR